MPGASRYARQIALDSVGAAGQQKLAAARVLVIGLGGLGCPAASYLVAAGVGVVTVNDFDSIDTSNLARQLLYADADVGRNKAEVARERLTAMNPAVRIEPLTERLSASALSAAAAAADLVVDATDNFQTRYSINEAVVEGDTPLISGAAIRFEGHLLDLGGDYATGPCYQCVFPEGDDTLEDCRGNGILGPVAGAIGATMASRAVLRLLGAPSLNKLCLYDGTRQDWTNVGIHKRVDCPICNR